MLGKFIRTTNQWVRLANELERLSDASESRSRSPSRSPRHRGGQAQGHVPHANRGPVFAYAGLEWGTPYRVDLNWIGSIHLYPSAQGDIFGWDLELGDGRLPWSSLRPDAPVWAARVVGNQYRPKDAQRAFRGARFEAGRPIRLRRDPNNALDANAVEVWDGNATVHVDFLPRDWAQVVAEEMDAGNELRAWTVWENADPADGRSIYVMMLRGESRIVPLD